MRHFSKILMFLSSSVITLSGCYDSVLDMPAEKLSGDKVHAQMYVSLNYDDAVFAGDANVSNRRFIVEARDAENTENIIERKEIVYNTASTLTEGFQRLPIVFELDQKKYVVSVWMDYIETGTDKDFYYNTEDLSKISMITPESAADVHRDALASTQTIDLTVQALGAEFAVNAQLVTHIAKWRLIANDWKNLLTDKEEAAKTAVINVAYNSGVSKGFNLHTASTVNIQEGIFFESPIKVSASEENTKITLAEDYFFTSQDEETISLTVNVKSAEGEEWHKTENVSLTCKSGKENKLESNYLTGQEPIKEKPKFEGEGTEASPYLIKSANDLTTLMSIFNEENTDYDYQNANYKQTNNIEASTITDVIAIGTTDFPFKGTYNGDGKTISNNKGLFGVIEYATIKDVRLSSCAPDANSTTAGIICNTSKGTSTIENSGCEVIGQLTLKNANFGGICGEVANGTLNITGCRIKAGDANGQFKLTNSNSTIYLGGFIGKISTNCTVNITDSYYTLNKNMFASNKQTDNCIGGLCGSNEGTLTVTRCYVIAKVQSGGTTAFGGIIVGKGDATVSECYTKSKNVYGGQSTKWTKNSTDENVTQFSADTWPTWATDNTAWGNIGNAASSTYPTLKWENEQ